MTPEPNPIDHETVSDRGFHHWEPIVPAGGRGDGSDAVHWYESSSAAAIVGGTIENPDIVPGPFAWLKVGETTAHLTRDEVVQLHAYIERWLFLHPEEEDEP